MWVVCVWIFLCSKLNWSRLQVWCKSYTLFGRLAHAPFLLLYGGYVVGSWYTVYHVSQWLQLPPVFKVISSIETVSPAKIITPLTHTHTRTHSDFYPPHTHRWGSRWRVIHLFVRMPTRFFILGTKMMTMVQPSGTLDRSSQKCAPLVSISTLSLPPRCSTETTTQGKAERRCG